MHSKPAVIKFTNKSLFYLSLLFLVVCCGKKEGGEPSASVASGLTYSPALLELKTGVAGSSVKPTVNGTSPITYSLTISPANSGITIDGQGIIKADATLTSGEYNVTVNATNTAGTSTFPAVFKIEVTPSPILPSALIYSPNALTMEAGEDKFSVVPTINGSTPITFSVTSSPVTSAITIDNSGKLHATNQLAAGTYMLSVTATNAAGSLKFDNVYTATVTPSASATAITFTNDIQAIITSNCKSCHIDGVQTKYNVYSNAKTNVDLILDRIKRAQGSAGMMPNLGTRLPQATIDLIQKWKDDGLKE